MGGGSPSLSFSLSTIIGFWPSGSQSTRRHSRIICPFCPTGDPVELQEYAIRFPSGDQQNATKATLDTGTRRMDAKGVGGARPRPRQSDCEETSADAQHREDTARQTEDTGVLRFAGSFPVTSRRVNSGFHLNPGEIRTLPFGSRQPQRQFTPLSVISHGLPPFSETRVLAFLPSGSQTTRCDHVSLFRISLSFPV